MAESVNFVGSAQLRGYTSMGGRVEGKLVQSAEHSVAVTATELGEYRGRHHRQHKLCHAPNRWPAGRHKRQCDAA